MTPRTNTQDYNKRVYLVFVQVVEGGADVDALADLAPVAVLEVVDAAVLDGAPRDLGVGHEVPQVDAFLAELPDVEIEPCERTNRWQEKPKRNFDSTQASLSRKKIESTLSYLPRN